MASADFTTTSRRLGIGAGSAVAILEVAYAVTLAVGFASLDSPDQPIGDPMFSILEILIIALAPALVALMVAVHAWAPAHAKALSLSSIVFMGLMAGISSCLHFVILTLSRQPAFAELPWFSLIVAFRWPSLAYSLDIFAWDVLFPLSVLFAAPVFSGSRLAVAIRTLLIASGVLSLAGLAGVVTGDMELRNIGIIGYVGVFVVAAALLTVLFYRTRPSPAT